MLSQKIYTVKLSVPIDIDYSKVLFCGYHRSYILFIIFGILFS